MPKKFRLILAVLALGVMTIPAFATSTPPVTAGAAPSGDPVVAKVNGQDIMRSDVLHELQLMGPQAEQIPPQILYREVLKKMIATKLVAAQGYADKLQDTPEAKGQLKDAEAQIVAQLYVRKAIQPKISEAKIKEHYDELAAKYKPQDEVRASHILFTGPNAEADATQAIKDLKGGADFAKMAQEKSHDTGSSKQGGDLGWFTRDVMVKEFADAAFAMKPGEISDKPIKTSFGYHVIKVVDKRKSSPPPIADVHDQLANQLGQEMTNELIKGLEAKAKIEEFNMDGTPMKTADEDAKKK
jgi:peptidyl-prolyl cis-trans isomerase C